MASDEIVFRPIGRVENEIDEWAMPDVIRAVESRIVLDPAYVDGLKGLAAQKRVMVVFYFDRADGYALQQHPRGDASRPLRGVFALCSPNRPNGIGVTVVDLLEIDGNVLHVTGLDAINSTPVLDLKPAD
mgnify:CR=1 FL=1